ncbi:hypothetical protein Dvina_53365 [Dactylosporangium vinaceum]|uniref:Uncharacterized protein n=1 Tax=Dactylosporangium vinaceum TaxID=53362 RepID=A0ABV5MQ08_9ACTN|nr:hypothetical protein [Dactylosporangium vinaceum]UAB96595.1 hypothetical protein Dvina_53365 [Dactylosporangium vinaceum]
MDLKDAMYEASDTPPPTTIDVDRLIAGERRRTHGLRLAGVVAGLTVLALGATLMPRYFGDNLAPPVVAAAPTSAASPGSSPRPTPTWLDPMVIVLPSQLGSLPPPEAPCSVAGHGAPPRRPMPKSCDDMATFLTATFAANLPDEILYDFPAPRFVRDPSVAMGFAGGRDYVKDGHRFAFLVRLVASPDDQAGWADRHPCAAGCRVETVNGLTVHVTNERRIETYKADGTEVTIEVQVDEPGFRPFAVDSMIRSAGARETTLYPTWF